MCFTKGDVDVYIYLSVCRESTGDVKTQSSNAHLFSLIKASIEHIFSLVNMSIDQLKHFNITMLDKLHI